MVCSKPILINYPSHPGIHSACKGLEISGKKQESLNNIKTTTTPTTTTSTTYSLPTTKLPRSYFTTSETMSLVELGEHKSYNDEKTTNTSYTDTNDSVCLRIICASSYYEVLELNSKCTTDEIKKSYRRLALLVHPDKNPSDYSSDAFKVLSMAFACLSNESTRLNYDLNKTVDDEVIINADKLVQQSIVDLLRMFNDLFRDLNRSLWGSLFN
eukprot:TRINITY_DN7371_c0_g1_i1.p1 TRINITY_DN7371_c0_g1~~TRINITY_DN7371_c0_g1_i1.p1  ORF type:complete len:213 (-),score=32.73 TRINITY_DN7371_c0_g1_i1:449-1087(-)